jgi:hypothetical protein
MQNLVVESAEQLQPVKDAEVIFVYTHLLEAFFKKILPCLTRPFILMSHNSDDAVDERFAHWLDHGRLSKWFAQNVVLYHEKLVSIPLGVANSQWPHGRCDLLQDVARRQGARTGLVYMNFDIRTNPARRRPVFNRFKNNPLVTVSDGLDYEAYLNELASHHFCICPPGNGLDCHRIWECIYLGVIPIISADRRLKGFDELPILYIDDWGDLDEQFLLNAYRELSRRRICLNRAYLDHWRFALDRERQHLRQADGCVL